MTAPAIRVQNLSKQYTIGARGGGAQTFREMLTGALAAPFRRWARLKGAVPASEQFWALQGLDFEVKAGEALGVIGRNGAGKSTLLKILSRITEPTLGRAVIRGRVSSLLEVGTGFHPELTGRENIMLNGAILGMSRREILRKFDEIVAFAEVAKFLETPVKHYSSGMYVRLAFAVAAHLEPDILVVDEVLAVGDLAFQRKCMGRMSQVAHEGRTVILVSHNLGAIQALCHSAMYLDQGRQIAYGNAGEIARAFAADMQSRAAAATVREVGVDLALLKLDVGGGYASALADAPFTVELAIRLDTTVHDVSLMVFSPLGDRIGIVDCRSTGMPLDLRAGSTLRVEGHIKSLPLVEGEYRLGLYLRSSGVTETFDSLGPLTVGPAAEAAGVVPYPSAVRGFVEFSATKRMEVK